MSIARLEHGITAQDGMQDGLQDGCRRLRVVHLREDARSRQEFFTLTGVL